MAGTRTFTKNFAATIVTGDSLTPSLILEMLKGKIDNSELDAIGKTLVKQAFDRRPDVEKIVSNPYLFRRVKARCNGGGESSKVFASPLTKILRLRTAVGGAVGAVMIAAAIGLSLLSSQEKSVVNNEFQIPLQQADVARPLDPPQVDVGKLSQSRATNFETPRAEKVAVQNKRTPSLQALPDIEFESDGEFYPVAYTGDIEEAATGGRVIRVDMNRSSLFALGVNLPLENDAETVKADLLVGRDGVTRAVRFVR